MKKKKDIMGKINYVLTCLGFVAFVCTVFYLFIICCIDTLYMIGVLS